MRDNPDLDINWANEEDERRTALHFASRYNHIEVVKLLLAHPGINVNLRELNESTAFSICRCNGYGSLVEMLLKDPRVQKDEDPSLWTEALWVPWGD